MGDMIFRVLYARSPFEIKGRVRNRAYHFGNWRLE